MSFVLRSSQFAARARPSPDGPTIRLPLLSCKIGENLRVFPVVRIILADDPASAGSESRRPDELGKVKRMNRASFISRTLFMLALAAALWQPSLAAAAQQPNILLIVADDLGWNDVSYHGSRCRTPNIDRLVASGVELDQHYVQPVCSPTRAALLSGRYPSRFGPHATHPTNRRVFPQGTATLASELESLGYGTYLAGKWHLGSRMEWGPQHYGFDHSYGSLAGAADPWKHGYREGPYAFTWHRDEDFVSEEGNVTELLADQVLQWIHQQQQPWFIYVPFTAVHIPVDAPEEFKQQFEGEKFYDDPAKDESFKRYAAYTLQLDAKIGQFVAALEETGQRDNTLIVFTSDNGALEKGGNAYISDVPPTPVLGSNAPLRGWKGQLFEGGIRVPAFVNWPNVLAPRKVTAPIHVSDWMPTLTRFAGWQPQGELHWDGQDVWPLITGKVTEPEPRTIYWAKTHGKKTDYALRRGDWKLVVANGKTMLFNLADDPYEKHNLAKQHRDLVDQLQAEIATMKQKDLPEIPKDLRDYPG